MISCPNQKLVKNLNEPGHKKIRKGMWDTCRTALYTVSTNYSVSVPSNKILSKLEELMFCVHDDSNTIVNEQFPRHKYIVKSGFDNPLGITIK